MRYFFYGYLNGKKDYNMAGVYYMLYGIYIILYAIFLNIAINTSYKNWPAYQKISYKLTSYINIICIVIFIVLGILNTKVSKITYITIKLI